MDPGRGKGKRNVKDYLQDERLLILVGTFGSKSWYTISKLIQKPLIQCNRRYLELTGGESKLSRKGTWTKEEDNALREQVRLYGLKNWVLVSKGLPGRIGKQCRERWHKCLDPRIVHKEWTMEEDIIIVSLYYELGHKWAKIARQLKGRTDNSVKNRFNSNLVKRLGNRPFRLIREQAERRNCTVAAETSSDTFLESSSTEPPH